MISDSLQILGYHDQASDIAEIIISAGMNETNEIPEIDKMASAVSKMVHDSVASYVQRDLELAREVIEQDDAVDELFETVKRKLIATSHNSPMWVSWLFNDSICLSNLFRILSEPPCDIIFRSLVRRN